jgi:hypothetical protein
MELRRSFRGFAEIRGIVPGEELRFSNFALHRMSRARRYLEGLVDGQSKEV